MACGACQIIGRGVRSGSIAGEVDLGTIGDMEVRASHCEACLQMMRSLSCDRNCRVYLFQEHRPLTEFTIAATEERQGGDHETIDILPLAPGTPGGSIGLVLDPAWIHTPRLRQWLNFCEENHATCLAAEPLFENTAPLRTLLLVDVKDECLVSMPAQATRYLALSYVWGQLEDTFKTTKQNLSQLKQMGAISADAMNINLPQVIRDAIRLSKALSERYLWVDRLSIVQDDLVTKDIHINSMGWVFANAHCTIVAAEGHDASFGLSGVGHGSQPRSIHQKILDVADCRVLIQTSEAAPFTAGPSRVWVQRAWTFQEALLSRRLLIFCDDTVFWRCQRSIWKEDITAEPEGVQRPEFGYFSYQRMFQIKQWPDLRQWNAVVCEYNVRKLTFQKDVQAAFAGIESILSRTFVGGFCYGLPELFFDAALLWQPKWPLKRRTTGDPELDKTLFPSWSWICWEGILDTANWETGYSYLGAERDELITTPWTLKPLVEWYQLPLDQLEDLKTPQRRRIGNGYSKWKECIHEEAMPSSGWTIHPHENQHIFTHALAPDIVFRHPIPIAAPEAYAREGVSKSFPPYLHFRSTRAYFRIADRIHSDWPDMAMSVTLVDDRGSWAGILRLNVPGSDPVPVGQVCELVAMSEGVARNSEALSYWLEEWDLAERPKQDRHYSFYNVLWIRREDGGFAAREALGRVEKGAWERQGLDEVDVKLR